jgi:hypothetical protein
MKKWFIAKYNWQQTIEHSHACFLKNYDGLGGEIWPVCNDSKCECHSLRNKIEKKREYIEIQDSHFIFVCVDLALAKEYSHSLKNCHGEFPILLEIGLLDENPDERCDFGNPEGGFSIIETEILTKMDICSSKAYLDSESGLFTKGKAAYDFISRLNADEVEALDDYVFLSIKKIDL